MNITKQQLQCINAIISKRNIDKDTKQVMVQGFSNNRCTSTKDLTFNEAKSFIAHLKYTEPNKAALEKMKGKMMYYAREMGWTATNKFGKQVADVKRIDEWCLKYGAVKRKLDSYTFEELSKIVTQFSFVFKDYLKRI